LCRKAKKAKGIDPNCSACMPSLLNENAIPVKIFARVQRQFITGPSGPIDHDQSAIWRWIDELEIEREDREWCFELVYSACRQYLQRVHEQQKKRTSK